MKSPEDTTPEWVPITKVAKCFHCSVTALRNWSDETHFRCRQVGPKLFEVDLAKALPFYRKKFPNIELDMTEIDALLQHTS